MTASKENSSREPTPKRWNFPALWRRRPRALTLMVLFAVVALIVPTNLSFELFMDLPANIGAKSCGWPLIWHRYVLLPWDGRTVGWYYSAVRLAGDIVIWLALVATSCGTCEWLLRRYRPKPRWSLRTMLVVVGLCGALFAWFAAARNRADLQDSLITEIGSGSVRMERWGPKWLDLIGADRFRRHITRADVFASINDDGHEKLERILPALGRLPRLRYLELFIEGDHLPPGMADALAKTRQLRALSICLNGTPYNDNDRRIWQECLAAIGKMAELEHLHLYRMKVPGTSLASLAGLTNLKRLILSDLTIDEQDVDAPMLANLARLPMLEELTIDVDMVTPAGLESLVALKRLRTLRINNRVFRIGDKTLAIDQGDGIYVPADELKGFGRALKVLRNSRPGIVIYSDGSLSEGRLGPEADVINGDYDANRQQPFSLPSSDLPWMTPAEKATFKAAGGWARFDAAGLSGRTVSF
ncbi:MAG TPA: hypothetical protein VMV10_28570 [Pirellulales bacterium]|nr:hypothetical protein [Pirellulales bacterium]